jgi:hypothetical protein
MHQEKAWNTIKEKQWIKQLTLYLTECFQNDLELNRLQQESNILLPPIYRRYEVSVA